MERQVEVTAAAEALRGWIHAQRATWDALPVPPAQRPESAATGLDFELEMLAAAAPSGAAVFTPLEPLTSHAAIADPFEAPAPAVEAPLTAESALPEPVPTAARAPREPMVVPWGTIARVAAVFAVVVVLGFGGRAGWSAWQRYASTPRIGTLVVESTPPGSEVLVDGAPSGATPLTLKLPAGAHKVELRRQRATRTLEVAVVKGESAVASVDWTAKPVGTLRVESSPAGATVTVDGRARGTTPVMLTDLTAGAHTLVIDSSAGSVRRRVQITAGQNEVLNEAIFPGWLQVSAPVDVTVSENGRALQLDTSNRVLIAPGRHDLRLENRALGIAERRQVDVEPGATATVALETTESSLTVTTSVEAEISVDGERVGSAPVTRGGLRVGTHDIVATDASGNTRRRTIRLTAAPMEVHIDFSGR